jgi:hypothetical protein
LHLFLPLSSFTSFFSSPLCIFSHLKTGLVPPSSPNSLKHNKSWIYVHFCLPFLWQVEELVWRLSEAGLLPTLALEDAYLNLLRQVAAIGSFSIYTV